MHIKLELTATNETRILFFYSLNTNI